MLGSTIFHEQSGEVRSVVHQAEPWTSEERELITLPTKRNRPVGGGGGSDEDMQFRMRVSACLMNFSSSLKEWKELAVRRWWLMILLNFNVMPCGWTEGQRCCFFLTQTKGPEDGGVVLRRGAHQWEVETSSYLWVGGTSQTSRSDTKGRGSLPLLNVLQSA